MGWYLWGCSGVTHEGITDTVASLFKLKKNAMLWRRVGTPGSMGGFTT